MYKSTSFTLSVLFMLCCEKSSGQYLIEHDFLKNKTSYFKISNNDTSIISAKKLRKAGKISIRVKNCNQSLWSLQFSVQQLKQDSQRVSTGAFNPFSNLVAGSGDYLSKVLPGLSFSQLSNRGDGNSGGASGRYVYLMSNYAALYRRVQFFNELSDDLVLATRSLKNLNNNPAATETEVKSGAEKIMKNTLGEQLSHADYFEIVKQGRQLRKEFSQALDSINDVTSEIAVLYPQLNQEASASTASFERMNREVKQNEKKINSLYALPDTLLKRTEELAQSYDHIQASSFTVLEDIDVNDNTNEIVLKATRRSEAAGINSSDSVTRHFTVNKGRNFTIRNSLGLSFSYIQARTDVYGVSSDSVLTKTKGDLATPLISTYITVFPFGGGLYKLGVNIGFGLPVAGERKDINYQLGLTAGLGKNEPLMIMAGLVGAQVPQLANGLKVGDKLPNNGSASVQQFNAFRIGAYIGVSFNLAQIK